MTIAKKSVGLAPVIKAARIAEAATKIGKAGLDRVYFYRRGIVEAEARLKELLAKAPLLEPRPAQLTAALNNYGCEGVEVYTDTFAYGYLQDARLTGQFQGFSRKAGKAAVPLLHALGAAFGFHQVSVVVDCGQAVKPAGADVKRIWFLNNRQVTAYLSPLPKLEDVAAEKVRGGNGSAKPLGVLKTIELPDKYAAEIRRDETGYFAQVVYCGADVGPKCPLSEADFPLERCHFLSLQKVLNRGPWTETLEKTLADFSDCMKDGGPAELKLFLECAESWERAGLLLVMVQGVRDHGLEENGIGRQLKGLLQDEIDKVRGGWRLIGRGKNQTKESEPPNEEAIAFFRWLLEIKLGASERTAHLIKEFNLEPRAFSD